MYRTEWEANAATFQCVPRVTRRTVSVRNEARGVPLVTIIAALTVAAFIVLSIVGIHA